MKPKNLKECLRHTVFRYRQNLAAQVPEPAPLNSEQIPDN